MPFLSLFSSRSSLSCSSSRITIALMIATALTIASAAPAAGEDLTALLARPISPGSIALLADHAGQPAAQKRLAEAVKHENPAVRAVAARIAFMSTSKGLAPALISAVAKEEHAYTAAEQVRALMGLLGAPGDQIVLRAVTRIGGPAAVVMAESLARTRPADIKEHLPTLLPLAYGNELGAALATACAQHPAFASEILQAVLTTKSPYLFDAVIGSLREAARPIPPAVLTQALQSEVAYQRNAVVWHLFFAAAAGDAIPEELAAAAAPKPIATGAASRDLTWEAYGREMLARFRGSRPVEADWAGLMVQDENIGRARSLPLEAYAQMTKAELKAMGVVREDKDAGRLRQSGRQAKRTDQILEARTEVMRTIPVFAQGLIGDMMAINGCRAARTAFAAGNVTYRPDGRAQSIGLIQASMSKECEAFVRGMMMLTIASPDHPVMPDLADRILLLFDPGYLACADNPFPPVRPRFDGAKIEWPERERDPDIVYPSGARVLDDGYVRLRVRLSHTGCVASVETIRSLHPVYDLVAIRGMFSARYKPMRVNGEPVDTTLSYSVPFYR